MVWNRMTPMAQSEAQEARVMILISHRSESDYRQWRDWWHTGLQKPPGTKWLESRGASLTTARTGLVRRALESDATHLFFLDDDVIAPDNVIPNLLAPNLPIVCGLYMAKKAKGERVLSAWMRASEKGYSAIGLQQDGRYVQIDATGLGCVLIQRQVFEKVGEPWFVWDPDSVSEDFFFFAKVGDTIGVKPVVDRDCRCLHIGVFALDTNEEFTTLEL